MSELSISNSSDLNLIKKQENLAKTMQDVQEPNQIEQQITRAIQAGLDPQTTLSKLASKLGENFQADACSILSKTQSKQITGLWHSKTILTEPILLSFPLAKAELVAIADLHSSNQNGELNVPQEQPLRALLQIPTQFQGKINGAIAIGQLAPRKWSDRERESLKKIADSIAIAIGILQLQEQNQSGHRYQALLKDLGAAIRYNVEIDSLRQQALKGTAKALEADRAAILMLKYKSPPIGIISAQQLSQIEARLVGEWLAQSKTSNTIKQNPFPLSTSQVCTLAFQKAPKPLALANTKDFPEDSILNNNHPNSESQTESAVLIVPLMGSITSEANTGVVLGFLLLQQDRDRTWLAEEIELANWVSTQLSTAILQDQALNKVQSIVDRRTAQLKWSLEVQAKLSEGMRQHIEQLKELNQLKDKFVETISHNLKTPLTTMRMAIEMLRQYGEYPDRRQRYIDFLDKAWTQENKLIQDLLTLQELESNRYSFQPQQLDLKEIVKDLREVFTEQQIKEQLGADKTVTLEVNYPSAAKSKQSSDSSVTIYTDPKSLKQILSELLGNAAKYSEPNTSVQLNISQESKPQANKIILQIINHGVGISSGERSHIFDKFRRGEKATHKKEVPGLGVGLTLVKYLVEHINGTIEVSSDPTSDPDIFINTFTVVLPQQPLQPQ
ncbi:MAG: ATP-binding protein [Prochloraceae cyanobacterium]